METENITHFASPDRSDPDTIEGQKKLLNSYYGPLRQLYEAVSEIILILNRNRQIVFFNSMVPSLLGIDDPASLYGVRPGEALDCSYACITPGGCGTSRFCSQCGAVKAILSALSNKADLQECRLLKRKNLEAFELLVRTTPLEIDGELFSVMAITDISHEKRRRALEHVFFHDIMNTLSSINLIAKILDADPKNIDSKARRKTLLKGLSQLTEELRSQEELLKAENNELEVVKESIDGASLVRNVVDVYKGRFPDHIIKVNIPEEKTMLHTDPGLLNRVLGNLILNAIEASTHAEPVTVTCILRNDDVEFQVHNETYIPEANKLQLFQRSFSTKGTGRGLGIYCVKLLAERYLGGNITFASSPRDGTVFAARFPKQIV